MLYQLFVIISLAMADGTSSSSTKKVDARIKNIEAAVEKISQEYQLQDTNHTPRTETPEERARRLLKLIGVIGKYKVTGPVYPDGPFITIELLEDISIPPVEGKVPKQSEVTFGVLTMPELEMIEKVPDGKFVIIEGLPCSSVNMNNGKIWQCPIAKETMFNGVKLPKGGGVAYGPQHQTFISSPKPIVYKGKTYPANTSLMFTKEGLTDKYKTSERSWEH
jgi:hypothetical protein